MTKIKKPEQKQVIEEPSRVELVHAAAALNGFASTQGCPHCNKVARWLRRLIKERKPVK